MLWISLLVPWKWEMILSDHQPEVAKKDPKAGKGGEARPLTLGSSQILPIFTCQHIWCNDLTVQAPLTPEVPGEDKALPQLFPAPSLKGHLPAQWCKSVFGAISRGVMKFCDTSPNPRRDSLKLMVSLSSTQSFHIKNLYLRGLRR